MCLGQSLAPFQDLVENKVAAAITQTGRDVDQAVQNLRLGHVFKGALGLALAAANAGVPEGEGARLVLAEGEDVLFTGKKIS